ncbi:RNA polymerase sigma factor [Ilumatobacter coccineus]|uniref:RNA polymerase sigma factor n=1 Tax=Ilumatobacter coccineus TaxID=467094 RepID=UPI00059C79BE|nr:RNA polymerase sigma factor [Ilumatobacter coccineus]
MEEFRPAGAVEADTELALALRSGDETAVRELYDRFGGLVFTVALRILGDRGHADEATQQTFLQAWRNSDRFEAGRDFAPWLATIARRTAIDIQRRERRRPAGSLEQADAGDAALISLPPDAAQIETTWVVRRAIEHLDPDERDVVRLQHVEGYTHTEIAERLGVAVGTVKSRSFRAHRRLSTRLAYLRGDGESTESAGGAS